MRECNYCNQEKPESDFYTTPAGKLWSFCRKCHHLKQKERLANDPELRERTFFRKNVKKLGLDPDALWEVYVAHNKTCDICGGPTTGNRKRLCVDHDHVTGEFRGFLCHNCNVALGLMKDSPELLHEAARYLESRA